MLGEDPLIWNRSWDSQNKIKWRFWFFLKESKRLLQTLGESNKFREERKWEKQNTQAFSSFWPRTKEILKRIIVDNIKWEDWNFNTHLHNNDTKLDFELWDLRWRWSWRRTQIMCLEKNRTYQKKKDETWWQNKLIESRSKSSWKTHYPGDWSTKTFLLWMIYWFLKLSGFVTTDNQTVGDHKLEGRRKLS